MSYVEKPSKFKGATKGIGDEQKKQQRFVQVNYGGFWGSDSLKNHHHDSAVWSLEFAPRRIAQSHLSHEKEKKQPYFP